MLLLRLNAENEKGCSIEQAFAFGSEACLSIGAGSRGLFGLELGPSIPSRNLAACRDHSPKRIHTGHRITAVVRGRKHPEYAHYEYTKYSSAEWFYANYNSERIWLSIPKCCEGRGESHESRRLGCWN
jgi:hypothetical protein